MVNKYLPAALPKILSNVSEISLTLLNQILPQRCFICNQTSKTNNAICHACIFIINNQQLTTTPTCLRCALPFDFAQTGSKPSQILCARCLQKTPHFDRCIAAVRYSPLSAQLINNFKHHNKLGCKNVLVEYMLAAIHNRHSTAASTHPHKQASAAQHNIDLLVPAPLHPKRLTARGFNQAAEIAKPIAKRLSIPISLNSCKRLTNNPAQQNLDSASRAKNLHNAFWSDCNQIAGKRIAIVDDVVTTTHTANAIAKSLIAAGAIGCEIWCFARTPTHS